MACFTKRGFCAVFVMVMFCAPVRAQEGRAIYHPPAADTIHAVIAEHGMVVAQEKIAAQIGADVLRHGGNAIDAAVATGFAMAVTYPRAGNIGGGGFMMIHSSARAEDVAIDYRETAPAATTPKIFSVMTANLIPRDRAIPRSASASPARWRD